MNPLSKLSLLISGLSLVVLFGARFVLGAWHNIFYVFVALFALGIMLSILFDYKLYLQILSVKTAKKGLSLGWSLLLLVVFLVAFSYFGKRFDKTFDWTTERLNSLSEQSQTALKNLKAPLVFYVFYKGDKIPKQPQGFKTEIKLMLDRYKQESTKIKIVFVDTYKKPLKAEEYLSNLPDKQQENIFLFVSYEGKKIRIPMPLQEEQVTSALIQAQKREFKEILFLTGHGERDTQSQEAGGIKALKQSLEDSGFRVQEWDIIQYGIPQNSPAVVAVLGPRKNFIELEQQWLSDYLSKGGSLFLALDPQEEHNWDSFLKDYGLLYKNNFVLSKMSFLYGRGNLLTAFGLQLDPKHPITKKFSSKTKTTVFDQASALEVNPSYLEQFQYSFIVRTDPQSLTVPKIETTSALVKKLVQSSKSDNFNLALLVEPKEESQKETKKEAKKNKAFKLLLFGDSDFLSNQGFTMGANKDLALNAFIFLAGEEDLISIRPKQPKGTKIALKSYHELVLILFYIALPLLFLITGLLMWFNKRNS